MRFNLFSVLLVISFSCNSQEKTVNGSGFKSNDERVRAITEIFARISNSKEVSREDEKSFFDAFPDSFSLFDLLYNVEGPLYENGYDHLMALYKMKTISKEKILERYINLSKGGIWSGDNTGDLQWQAFEVIANNARSTALILKNYSKEEIGSVFYFLLDGPHPNDKDKVANYRRIRDAFVKIDNTYGRTIDQEYEKVINARLH